MSNFLPFDSSMASGDKALIHFLLSVLVCRWTQGQKEIFTKGYLTIILLLIRWRDGMTESKARQ